MQQARVKVVVELHVLSVTITQEIFVVKVFLLNPRKCITRNYLITNNNVLYNLRIYKQYGHTNS